MSADVIASVFGKLVHARRWVAWRIECRGDDLTKIPVDPRTGGNAKSNDASTWGTLEDAEYMRDERDLAGVGIMLGGGLGGIDLDACRDPETRAIARWAKEIVEGFRSYTEISPSGTGLKVFAFGAPAELPAKKIDMGVLGTNGKKQPAIEVYTTARYFTVTGQLYDGAPDELRDCGEVGDAWDRLVRTLRERAAPSTNGKARSTGDEIPAGARNQTLTSLAGTMRRRGMSEDSIFAALLKENAARCEPPLHEDEVRDIAHSVARYAPAEEPAGDATPEKGGDELALGVRLTDFWAYMPMHQYIFVPTRELWPSSSVNARIPKLGELTASAWLDRRRAVEQMTWSPGDPEIIEDKLIAGGGWIERQNVRCFNLYRPPSIKHGDPTQAKPYLEHVQRVFPGEAEHILQWLAHRVQRPHEKINHALALIGPQGTGKDTAVAPVIPAVGAWNVSEVSPDQLMGRFNGFVKSVILRVSESRDLGDTDRYRFYEHLKVYTAAPPDVLRVDEKNIREYMVPNVTGVIITSNHTDGIYLPADDRRHYVALTELTKDNFTPTYWRELYGWYEREGYSHVAAYLASVDLSDFDPKEPPPKTPGFWQVVDAGRAPEDGEVSDVLERLDWPEAITLAEIALHAGDEFRTWLKDRKNARQVPHRMETAGYIAVRSESTKDGRWKVGGKNQRVYARRELSIRDRFQAAQLLATRS